MLKDALDTSTSSLSYLITRKHESVLTKAAMREAPPAAPTVTELFLALKAAFRPAGEVFAYLLRFGYDEVDANALFNFHASA